MGVARGALVWLNWVQGARCAVAAPFMAGPIRSAPFLHRNEWTLMSRRTPLLRPRHFHPGGALGLGPDGLRFAAHVHRQDREFECVVSGLAEREIEALLASSSKQQPGWVILNPRRPLLRRLMERVQLDRGALLRDGVSPMAGLPGRIARAWEFQARPGETYSSEGQSLLMVAAVDRQPVGFFSGSV